MAFKKESLFNKNETELKVLKEKQDEYFIICQETYYKP